jgi:hypothetical protein
MAHDVKALPENVASGGVFGGLDDESPEKALTSLFARSSMGAGPTVDASLSPSRFDTNTFSSQNVEGMPRGLGKDADDMGALRARKMAASVSPDSAFLPEIFHRSPLAAGSKSAPFHNTGQRTGNILAWIKGSMQHPAEAHAHHDEAPPDASTRSRNMLLHMRDAGPKGGMDPISRIPVKKKKAQTDEPLSLGKSTEVGADNEAEGQGAVAEKETEAVSPEP